MLFKQKGRLHTCTYLGKYTDICKGLIQIYVMKAENLFINLHDDVTTNITFEVQ